MVADLEVRHAGGSYPVFVRDGVLSELETFLDTRFPGIRRVVIADASVAAAVPLSLQPDDLLTFPSGEQHKTRAEWLRLSDELLTRRYGRDTVIIALGGGVTTDLAGFVAATLHRGVPWVAVPTSTLGMIDAAIGGKTGVDTPTGKNLVGAFHPPAAVFMDPTTLTSLPQRSYVEGLAEAVKHAAILDATYGEWMMLHADKINARDSATVTELVFRSAVIKAGVVSGDEREDNRRAILNAGHTVAHGLELATDFGIPHGEAVAIGLVIETRISEALGIASVGTSEQLVAMLASQGLPTNLTMRLDPDAVLEGMTSDKKNRAGVVRAALLERIGSVARSGADWTQPLDLALVRSHL